MYTLEEIVEHCTALFFLSSLGETKSPLLSEEQMAGGKYLGKVTHQVGSNENTPPVKDKD